MMGPHGAAPNGSDHSMASGLSSYEEEKVMILDREASLASRVSSQSSENFLERIAALQEDLPDRSPKGF